MIPDVLVHCSAAIDSHKPILLAMLLGGLTGSLSHCMTMCSPFVLAQLGGTEEHSLLAGLLLPYHLGRITTYTALGASSGAFMGLVSAYSWFGVLSKWLLATAGCFFLVAMLHRLSIKLPFRRIWTPRCAMSYLQRISQLSGFTQRYMLGLVLGLIPCGLVIAALMALASTGSAAVGAAGMLLFGLGTMPALLAVGMTGRFFSSRFTPAYRHASTAAMGLNSIILFILAGS